MRIPFTVHIFLFCGNLLTFLTIYLTKIVENTQHALIIVFMLSMRQSHLFIKHLHLPFRRPVQGLLVDFLDMVSSTMAVMDMQHPPKSPLAHLLLQTSLLFEGTVYYSDPSQTRMNWQKLLHHEPCPAIPH